MIGSALSGVRRAECDCDNDNGTARMGQPELTSLALVAIGQRPTDVRDLTMSVRQEEDWVDEGCRAGAGRVL